MKSNIKYFRAWVLGLIALGLLLISGGLTAQAKLDPLATAEHYFESGIRFYQAGQLHLAQNAFEQSLELNPHELDAHNNLGSIKAQLGDPEAALQEFRAELALDPNHPNSPRIFHNIGNSLLALGQVNEAILAFETALKQDPSLVESYISLASALHQLGDDEQAQSQLELALKLDPKNPKANHDLAILERSGNPQSALKRLDIALAAKPDWAEAHNSLAITLIQLGQLEEAIAEFRVSLLWDPNETVRRNLEQALRWLEMGQEAYC